MFRQQGFISVDTGGYAVRGGKIISKLLALGLFASVAAVVAAPSAQAAAPTPDSKLSTDWSKAMVESTMQRLTPDKLGPWSYTEGLYLYGEYLVFKRTGDRRYLDYI